MDWNFQMPWDISIEFAISTVLTIISLSLAAYFYIQNKKREKEIVSAQGIFEKSELDIKLFDLDNTHKFIFELPLKSYKPLAFPIPIILHNYGRKAAKEIQILIKLSDVLVGKGLLKLNELSPKAMRDLIGMEAEITDFSDNLSIISMKIREIHPKTSIIVYFPLIFSENTVMRDTISVDTADGKKLNIQYSALINWSLDFVIYEKDKSPRTCKYKIEVIDGGKKSVQDVLRKRNKEIEKEKKENVPNKKSWWKKLFKYSKLQEPRKLGVIQLNSKEVDKKKKYGLFYTVPNRSTYNISEGLKFKDGEYIIPALDIGWKKSEIQ